MQVKVGYITSWRRAIFFTLVFSIMIFGSASTLCNHQIGPGLVSNAVSVGVLFLCIIFFVMVLADYFGRYEGIGNALIQDGRLVYHDKKRHIDIAIKDIRKLDMEPIVIGQQDRPPIAYRMLIQVEKKKYYIESERARGANYDETDLYNLYIKLQKSRG